MKKSIAYLWLSCFLLWTGTSFSQITTKQEVKSDVTSLKLDSVLSEANKKSINNINGSMPNRISMNVTVPKQTQGATFGEKVNAGLHAAGSAIAQGASVTISGNLWWNKIEFPNIVNSVSSVDNLAGGSGGGAAAASYAKMGISNNATDEKATGISALFFTREAGSGMATGKRQYQPIYISKKNSTCDNCLTSLKSTETVYDYDIKKNQVKREVNSTYKDDNKDNDCDGITDIHISLINTETGQEVAKTVTGKCGNFSFPNISNGTYILQLTGNFLSKKGYDFYMAKSVDFQGKVQQNEETFKLVLTNNEEMPTENAIIKTKTKSNQSNDKIANNNSEIFIVKMDNSYGDIDNDGTSDLIVGGAIPGGTVISSALNARAGNPIGGLNIKGGKNPGGNILNKVTNDKGEFEFLNLESGNYKFIIERTVFIKSEVQIELTTKTKHDTVKNSIQNIR
ncbi:MAG: hypothetical protein Q8J84_01325 [Flavobacteriaceae bacterium]|nr:hypothetical protein [Flavobacteriaceae bacterium]